MKFNANTKTKSENQFVASMVSRKTNNAIYFINPMDSYIRAVFTKDIKDVTAEEFIAKVGTMFENENYYMRVVDRNKPLVAVDPSEY